MRGTPSPKLIITRSRMTNPEVLKFRSRALRALRGEAQPTTKRSRPTQAHGHARRAWLPLRNMLTRRLVLILAFAPPAASHNGYSFSVSGGMHARAPFLRFIPPPRGRVRWFHA